MTPPAASVGDAFLDILGRLSNAGLTLDPLSASRLESLDGRRLRLEISLPEPADTTSRMLCVEICVVGGQVLFNPADTHWEARPPIQRSEPEDPDSPPDVIVRGSPAGLLGWLTNSQTGTPAFTFEGDETLLADFAGLFRNYRPDFTEPLTDMLGKPLTDNLIGTFEVGLAALKTAVEGLQNTVQQTAESRFVASPAMEILLDTQDALRLRVDRLAGRVREVERNRETAPGPGPT